MKKNIGEKIKLFKSRQSNINRVVIIGGGFAGIRTALDLLKKSNSYRIHPVRNTILQTLFKNHFQKSVGGEVSNGVHITLLDQNHYHSYHPDYYEAAAAVMNEFKKASFFEFVNLHQTVAIPFENIFRKYADIQILKDGVSEIDFARAILKTSHKKEIAYDWLVIAAGSRTSFYNIPHLQELSYELKTVNDALNIRNGIDEIFSRKAKRDKINIIIGGGGFTGCELAGEIIGYVKNLAKIHNHPLENIEITIVEASSSLIKEVSDWAREKTKKRLENLGVAILLNSPIVKVSKNERGGSIYIKNGGGLDFDILIWTAGVEASEISNLFSKESLEKKLCLNTDQHLLVPPFKNVFAAGDIAYCFNPRIQDALPMTAQTAISQGAYAAYAIIQKIRRKSLKPYQSKQSRFIIPLGGKYALADLKFIKFSGFFAWLLKHLVTLRYFLSILPFWSAISFWLRGLKVYIKND